MRKKRPLDRRTKVFRDASLVVIASEDKYAVHQYFDFFESTRIQFLVLQTEDGKSAPLHLLERLEEYSKEYEIGPGDTFWLVCDCDHWIEPSHIGNLKRVIQECRQKRIRVAMSNPCFDLWLYLHFADFPPVDALTCDEVGKRLRVAAGSYDKTRVYNLPIDIDKVTVALQRSASNPLAEGAIPSKPMTAVHLIIESLVEQKIISVRPEINETSKKRRPVRDIKKHK